MRRRSKGIPPGKVVIGEGVGCRRERLPRGGASLLERVTPLQIVEESCDL